MTVKRAIMSLVISCCFFSATVHAATTVISTVDTKSGVKFHGENPNKLEQGNDDTPHKGSSEGSSQKGNLPQTGEVKASLGYKISGSFILASGLVGYFFNKKNNKNKDVS